MSFQSQPLLYLPSTVISSPAKNGEIHYIRILSPRVCHPNPLAFRSSEETKIEKTKGHSWVLTREAPYIKSKLEINYMRYKSCLFLKSGLKISLGFSLG